MDWIVDDVILSVLNALGMITVVCDVGAHSWFTDDTHCSV